MLEAYTRLLLDKDNVSELLDSQLKYQVMKIICVAGISSGIGKTAVACFLIRHISGCSALKMTVCHDGPCPKNKPCNICSSLGAPYKVITDPSQIDRQGTDTGRLKQAGAQKVVWGQTSPEHLHEAIDNSLSHFREDDIVIVEGNSFLNYKKADVAVMVVSDDDNVEVKESAVSVFDKIDFIVVNKRRELLVYQPSDSGFQLPTKVKLAELFTRTKRTFNLVLDGYHHLTNEEFLEAVCRKIGERATR